ncbi:MAG: SMC-Scp complex subunit ScpB [Patescibacteria group bacterium]
MTTHALLEAALYAAGQSVSIRKLAQVLDLDEDAVMHGLKRLQQELIEQERGLVLMLDAKNAELVTSPEAADAVRSLLDIDAQGELSKASMEALAILAYRGPMTRPELEQIRGIQSSTILRILSMRGLIEAKEEMRLGQPIYAVTPDFFKHIGFTSAEELPDYEQLHNHVSVETVLKELEPMVTQPPLSSPTESSS